MFVKICGLSSMDAIEAATSAGADAIGFVFSSSIRQVTPNQALKLCRNVPPEILRVAVMLRPTKDEWVAVRDTFVPDWLQTDAADFGILSVPVSCAPLPVYRTEQSPPQGWPRQLLFEGSTSGSGETADWEKAKAIASSTRLILAGGLTVSNVTDAISHVRPWGVDVSSGVESQPGHKDPAKIRAFVARAMETS
ncbi:uncharacterized protein METZ01_LOCUS135595 [marine metagenome]|uniref:phosphoribosylanthranilate isomerase n=1 Tax=marine metagenome TaxID=408172 RepID=A0A381Z1D7_9ZZZZ